MHDFRVAHRGGVGVRTIPTDKRNGKVIGLAHVTDKSNLLLIDQAGKIIRLPSTEVRTMGRQAKGVRLIRLDEGQKLSSVVAFEEDETLNQAGGQGNTPSGNEPTNDHIPETPQAQFQAASFEDFSDEDEDIIVEHEIEKSSVYASGKDTDPFADF